MLKWDFPCFSVFPLPLVMSLGAIEKSGSVFFIPPREVFMHIGKIVGTPDSQTLISCCRFVGALLVCWSFSS